MSWNPSRPNNTRQARTMRARVLSEEPFCREGCGQPSTHDDHIVGWSEREAHGLSVSQWHARSNHQGLCKYHHDQKTAAERARGRARSTAVRSEQPAKTRPPERHPGLIE